MVSASEQPGQSAPLLSISASPRDTAINANARTPPADDGLAAPATGGGVPVKERIKALDVFRGLNIALMVRQL